MLKVPDGSKEYIIVTKLKKIRAKPNLVTLSLRNINEKKEAIKGVEKNII